MRRLGCLIFIALPLIIVSWYGLHLAVGENSFVPSPFCKTLYHFDGDATISYKGEQYASNVTQKYQRPRDWVSSFGIRGCKQTKGKVFVFKAKNNEVVLMSSSLCYKAQKTVTQRGDHDIKEICGVRGNRTPPGYIVNNAETPSKWKAFRFSKRDTKDEFADTTNVRLISYTAHRSRKKPKDDLEEIAPNLLWAHFNRGNSQDTLWPRIRRSPDRQHEGEHLAKYIVEYADF